MANSNGWGDGAANNAIGWGKGSDNAIGWGSVYSVSSAGLTDIVGVAPVDADAQAFITAAAITDPTQQAAINTLVVDLKGYNVWTKMKALYPMVGGTSTSTSYNLRNTAQYQLTWIGGVTWNANGVTFGVNGYANTNFLDSNFTTSSGAMGGYSRTNNNVSAYDMGVYSTALAKGSYMGFSRNAATYEVLFQASGSAGLATNTNGTGFYSGGKNAVNSLNGYRNGVSLISTAQADNSAVGQNIYIGTLNNNNSPLTGYSQRNWAFAFMSDGLNATENANFYTAVQAFQTTLARQV